VNSKQGAGRQSNNTCRLNQFRRFWQRRNIRHADFIETRDCSHSALAAAADQARSPANQMLAQELPFAFAEVPKSADIDHDFAGIARQRGMKHYEEPLAWAWLLLSGHSPITGIGSSNAPTLLFPMATGDLLLL